MGRLCVVCVSSHAKFTTFRQPLLHQLRVQICVMRLRKSNTGINFSRRFSLVRADRATRTTNSAVCSLPTVAPHSQSVRTSNCQTLAIARPKLVAEILPNWNKLVCLCTLGWVRRLSVDHGSETSPRADCSRIYNK